MNTRDRTAFTIIEMLTATAIAVLVIGAAALLLSHTVRGTRAIEESLDLVVRGRAAMDWIARDLATARAGLLVLDEPAGPSSQSLRWAGLRTNAGTIAAAEISYAYVPGSPSRLVRTVDGGAEEEILSNVRRFRVEDFEAGTGRFREIHAQTIWTEPPSAVRITLTIADALGRRERTVRRVVFLGKRRNP